MANRFKKMIQPLLDEARREGYKAGHEDGMNDGFRKKTLAYENEIKFLKVLVERLRVKPMPRPRPKGWQPMGAKSFIEYCPTCKNDGSDLCGLCAMEVKSGYDPKENNGPVVPGPDIDDPNIMELCFHNGERHMKEQMLVKLTALCEGLGLDYNKIVFIQRSLWDL